MKVKVDYKELDIVKDNMVDNSQELKNSIENINSNILELKNIWQGEEANKFIMKFDNYIAKLRTVPETYDNLSHFLAKANILYQEIDKDIKKEINNVRMNN